MARIQILELPMRHAGDFSETPFVLVIDSYDDEAHPATPDVRDELAKQSGAVGVIVSSVELHVA